MCNGHLLLLFALCPLGLYSAAPCIGNLQVTHCIASVHPSSLSPPTAFLLLALSLSLPSRPPPPQHPDACPAAAKRAQEQADWRAAEVSRGATLPPPPSPIPPPSSPLPPPPSPLPPPMMHRIAPSCMLGIESHSVHLLLSSHAERHLMHKVVSFRVCVSMRAGCTR